MFSQKCHSVFQAVPKNLCFHRHLYVLAFQIINVMKAVITKCYVEGKKNLLYFSDKVNLFNGYHLKIRLSKMHFLVLNLMISTQINQT